MALPPRPAGTLIKLCTFGEPSLHGADGTPLEGLPRRYTKKFALLIYLACGGRRSACRRDELVALFWPESTKSHSLNSLRQSLFVIRRELGAEVISGLGAQEIAIDGRHLTSDVDAFERALRGGRPEAALKLYADDFLSGFHLSGSPAFGFWVDEQRERLRARAARAAEGLARKAEASRALSDALFWWKRRLDIDPYDEPTICRIVSLMATAGNRAGASKELERFRRRVSHDIDVDLSPATQEIASKLASGALIEPPRWIRERRHDDVSDDAWSGLRRATDQAQF
jgi:DNA-binding SARP family transcriptional activator